MDEEDRKWVRYLTHRIMEREGSSYETAYQKALEETRVIREGESVTECPKCGARLKLKNLGVHMCTKHPIKIKWRNIPMIKEQQKEKKRLSELAGKPKTKFVSGGLPSLGKKK